MHVRNALRSNGRHNAALQNTPVFASRAALALRRDVKGKKVLCHGPKGLHVARVAPLSYRIVASLNQP